MTCMCHAHQNTSLTAPSANKPQGCVQVISRSSGKLIPSTEINRGCICYSGVMIAASDPPFRVGILTGSKWETGTTLKVAFCGGSTALKERVQRFASEWIRHAEIKFDFVRGEDGDIRVAFSEHGGSWSYVGTGCRSVDSSKPTMQLGVSDSSNDLEVQRTVLHEFGHAIGLVHWHEHSPSSQVAWNWQAILNAYKGTLDSATIERNIFWKFDGDEVEAALFDRYSIMLCPTPASWTYGTFSSHWNDVLSATDMEFVREMYPPLPDLPRISNPETPVSSTTHAPSTPPASSTSHAPSILPVPPTLSTPSTPISSTPSPGGSKVQERDLLSDGAYYFIINVTTRTYLDVSGYNGIKVQAYQNNGGYLNQKWIASKSGSDWLFKNARTGSYLGVNDKTQANSPVTVSKSEVAWRLIPRNEKLNRYSLALASNTSLTLCLKHSSRANETPAIVCPSNQVWELVKTSKGKLT